jgi:hypothetical protein
VILNGAVFDNNRYATYHAERIERTMSDLVRLGATGVLEVGGHPWAMTSAIVDRPGMELCAAVSAEEISLWPDDIGVERKVYSLETNAGNRASFPVYLANIERTRFVIREEPDTVIACEMIEHLIRSPHVMLLNVNSWLSVGGHLIVTTPNGARFTNPFKVRSPTAGYRASVYSRHSHLFTLDQLVELVELCGFRISDASFTDDRLPGLAHGVKHQMSRLPGRLPKELFAKGLHVVATKEREVQRLQRVPAVYGQQDRWDDIEQAI